MNAMFVVTVVVVILAAQTTALTTFGGTKPENNKTAPAQPPQAKGRECKSDSECSGVTNTVCMKDWRDSKSRCLCMNKFPPANGVCPKYPKALSSLCVANEECVPNAHCTVSNSTTKPSSSRVCLCTTGFEEEDHMCNTGLISAIPSAITFLTISFLPRWF